MSDYTPGTGYIAKVQSEAYQVSLRLSTAVITRTAKPNQTLADQPWVCSEHGAGHCEHVAEFKLQQFKARTEAAKADEARQAELHAKAAHLVDGRIVPPTAR